MGLFLDWLQKLSRRYGLQTPVEVRIDDGGQLLLVAADGASASLETSAPSAPEHPLARLEHKILHIRHALAICSAWPMERSQPWGRIVAQVTPKSVDDIAGLSATLTVSREFGDGCVDSTACELVIASYYVLGLDEEAFAARLRLWQAQCASVLDNGTATPLDLVFEPPPREGQPDPTGELFVRELGLDAESVGARVKAAVEWVESRRPLVEARYREIYRLPLPRDIIDLAALTDALGATPRSEPAWYGEEAPYGWSRGCGWLTEALLMSPAGITEWFAPGGLLRVLRDASKVYHAPVPPDLQGTLDARLDMRFRCDAPQFVTFASGNSDGLHWGCWYDSPIHRPRIAHNYARDSAETWCDEEPDLFSFLEHRIEELREELLEDDESDPCYFITHLRAIHVVEVHMTALAQELIARGRRDEPPCPWPLSETYPIGSPSLALPPGAGLLDPGAPGFTLNGDPTEAQLREAITLARLALTQGQPAHALGLGLYLHWYSLDALQTEAGELLRDAYLALGWDAFADILRVHLLHRNLPSVGVFEEEPWPAALPTAEQIASAPAAVQVAWDWLQRDHADREALRDRDVREAHARARRLGLDWGDPVQRVVAAWTTDEPRIRLLLGR